MEPHIIMAFILLGIALVLLLHHGYKHSQEDPKESDAKKESCGIVCFFQPKDITNHETWILVCLTNALSLGVIGPLVVINQTSNNITTN